MLSKNIKYLIGVDHLRGMAALLVLLYHSTQLVGADIAHKSSFISQNDYGYTHWNIFKSFISEGSIGVAIFMTLSGFIFTYGLYGKKFDTKKFFSNRFIRIYPLYIFLALLSLYMYPPAQGSLLQSVILSVLPLGNLNGEVITTGVVASAAMLWTITVEVQFYLVFPFLIKFLNEHKFKILWGIIGLFTTFRLIAFLAGDVNMSLFGYFSIFGRIDEFIIGMLGAYVFLSYRPVINKHPRLYLFGSAATLVLFLFFINRLRHHFGFSVFENFYVFLPTIEGLLSAALIVSYVNIFNKQSQHIVSRLFAKIGELSYSIYLTHFLVIGIVISKVHLPNIVGSWWWSALFYGIFIITPLSVGLSLLTFNFIEKPFLNMRKKYVFDKKLETAQQEV